MDTTQDSRPGAKVPSCGACGKAATRAGAPECGCLERMACGGLNGTLEAGAALESPHARVWALSLQFDRYRRDQAQTAEGLLRQCDHLAGEVAALRRQNTELAERVKSLDALAGRLSEQVARLSGEQPPMFSPAPAPVRNEAALPQKGGRALPQKGGRALPQKSGRSLRAGVLAEPAMPECEGCGSAHVRRQCRGCGSAVCPAATFYFDADLPGYCTVKCAQRNFPLVFARQNGYAPPAGKNALVQHLLRSKREAGAVTHNSSGPYSAEILQAAYLAAREG